MSAIKPVRSALFATLTAAVLAAPVVQACEADDLCNVINEDMRTSINAMRESVNDELQYAVQRQVKLTLEQSDQSEPSLMIAQVDNKDRSAQ